MLEPWEKETTWWHYTVMAFCATVMALCIGYAIYTKL